MEDTLKIGGFYKTKDNGWFFVNKYLKKDGLIAGRFIYIDESGYDEEIVDLEEHELRKQLLDEVCWTGKYHKVKGLYAVWDGGNKETLVTLQQL